MEFNKELTDIKVYEAGKPIELVVREFGISRENIIKLASNENPHGCSENVIKAVEKSLKEMNLYPDDTFHELKSGLAEHFLVESKNIIIGAGSDQVIEFAVGSKCSAKSGILIAKTTFAMYEIYAKQVGAKVFKTPSHQHNLEEFWEIYKKEKDNIGIIFLCLPNNPLGESLNTKDVYDFISKIDDNVMVVIDGAYQEYAKYKDKQMLIKPDDLVRNFSNTLYLGTFSKAYGLGGMRVGYGIASTEIITNLHKLRPPFNISSLSLKSAIEALKDKKFVSDSIKNNFEQMKRYEEFCEEYGFKYIESWTNFLTIYTNKDSTEIFNELLKKGVIIRDLVSYGLNAIRVTIGTEKQNDRFFAKFKEIY